MFSGSAGLGFERLANSVNGDYELSKEEQFRREVVRRQLEEEVRFRDATGLQRRREIERLKKQEQRKNQRFESDKLKKRLVVACLIVLLISLGLLYLLKDMLWMM